MSAAGIRINQVAGGVPRTPADITPRWLTSTLPAGFQQSGVQLASVRVEVIAGGQIATTLRLHLGYSGDAAFAPSTVICKLSSQSIHTRTAANAIGLYLTELEIYQHKAMSAQVDTPRPYFMAVDSSHGDFILLMEDLQPARQPLHREGCSTSDAQAAMAVAAALHGPSRGADALNQVPFLKEKKRREIQNLRLTPLAVETFLSRHRASYSEDEVRTILELPRVYPRVLQFRAADQTLQHGDFRLQNILFDARGREGKTAVIDWQTARIGFGPADISSFLGGSLQANVRRSCERSLVDFYAAELARWETSAPGPSSCWFDYQRFSVYALGSSILSVLLMQHDADTADFLLLIQRHVQQVIEHDAISMWK